MREPLIREVEIAMLPDPQTYKELSKSEKQHVYEEALAILQDSLSHDWLINSKVLWYSLGEVEKETGIGRESIRKWCLDGEFPEAINYDPPQIGWRIPKTDLVIYYARLEQKKRSKKRIIPEAS